VRPPAVDLAAAARAALAAEGVEDAAIATVDACTCCEPDRFYSFRRDGQPSGRQGGLVWATG
jgi:polyphenol oxidase